MAVLDLARARTRRFDAVFVIGLEQGTLPRRAPTSPFFDDEDAPRARRSARRPAPAARRGEPRPLPVLHRLHPAEEAAHARTRGGDRRRLTPGGEPVLGGGLRAVRRRTTVRLHTTRRPLARLTWPIEAAPTERERLRALARLAADDPKRGRRARVRERLAAQARPGDDARSRGRPAITHPRALALLASRETFRVTDLERMAGCSAAWFVERYLPPGRDRPGDRPPHARLDRARRAAALLQPAARRDPGAERVTPANVEAAVRLMHDCVDSALESGLRIDADDLQRRELGQSLQRDLEQLVRAEAAAALDLRPAGAGGQLQGLRACSGSPRERQDRPRRPRPA